MLTVDISLPDVEELHKLVQEGQEKGFLTYDEIVSALEEVELTKPRKALDDAGAKTSVVSIKSGKIQGMNHADKGAMVDVDVTLADAKPQEFDALLIPGGLMNPDTLRSTDEALEFVRHFFRQGKPVAAICHAAWMLVEADVVRVSVAADAARAGSDPGASSAYEPPALRSIG